MVTVVRLFRLPDVCTVCIETEAESTEVSVERFCVSTDGRNVMNEDRGLFNFDGTVVGSCDNFAEGTTNVMEGGVTESTCEHRE